MASSRAPSVYTILVVGADASIRRSTVQGIAGAGYPVLEASGVDDALAVLENRIDIRLVINSVAEFSAGPKLLESAVKSRWPYIDVMVAKPQHRLH